MGHGGDAVVVLGTMGKIYLMYLVVVMVAVLMNLERMLRTAPGHRPSAASGRCSWRSWSASSAICW